MLEEAMFTADPAVRRNLILAQIRRRTDHEVVALALPAELHRAICKEMDESSTKADDDAVRPRVCGYGRQVAELAVVVERDERPFALIGNDPPVHFANDIVVRDEFGELLGSALVYCHIARLTDVPDVRADVDVDIVQPALARFNGMHIDLETP